MDITDIIAAGRASLVNASVSHYAPLRDSLVGHARDPAVPAEQRQEAAEVAKRLTAAMAESPAAAFLGASASDLT